METAGDDEKKPFDAEMAGPEDNHFPDPDETMTLKGSGGQLWMVKVTRLFVPRLSIGIYSRYVYSSREVDTQVSHGKMGS
jgi:hypothetical protein